MFKNTWECLSQFTGNLKPGWLQAYWILHLGRGLFLHMFQDSSALKTYKVRKKIYDPAKIYLDPSKVSVS